MDDLLQQALDQGLIHVCTNGNVDKARKYIEKGANVNAYEMPSLYYLPARTALHYAARNGYTEVVKLLIDKGAKVDATDEGGDTALHWAAKNGHIEIFEILEQEMKDKA